MTMDYCRYRFQPFPDVKNYKCKLLNKVTEYGLVYTECNPETCPIMKGCTVDIPAALSPILEHQSELIRKLTERIDALEQERAERINQAEDAGCRKTPEKQHDKELFHMELGKDDWFTFSAMQKGIIIEGVKLKIQADNPHSIIIKAVEE